MDAPFRSSSRSLLTSAVVLFLAGGGIVALTIFFLTPTVWGRWLLFFGETLGLTGLALPVAWFLHLRFPSQPPAEAGVILRQAIWVGVYGAVLTWLQQARLVTLWTGLGLALGLVVIEYLIRMRERVRWSPPVIHEPETIAEEQASAEGEAPASPEE